MPESWKAAFIAQARADYDLLTDLLQNDSARKCHRLHQLQVTTEKLAKAFLATDDTPPPTVHAAFVRFLQVSKRNPRLRALCRLPAQQFKEYVDSLLPLARDIEALAPTAQLNQPNPEYPWSAGATVIAPADHLFPDLDFRDPKMIKLLDLLARCFDLV